MFPGLTLPYAVNEGFGKEFFRKDNSAKSFFGHSVIEYPQMWVWPQVPLEGLPLHPPPCTLGPDWAAPSRSIAKRAKGGVGGRRRERAGREGLCLEGGPSNCNWGMGGGSKHQLGPDPHLGAPKVNCGVLQIQIFCAHPLTCFHAAFFPFCPLCRPPLFPLFFSAPFRPFLPLEKCSVL